MNKRIQAFLVASVVFLGGGVLAAPAAQAADRGTMPSGCSIQPYAPTLSGSRVFFRGTGYCNSLQVTNFVARLVHNYDNLPDVRVMTVTRSPANRPNYDASGSTCDGGGRTQYYTESGYYRSAANGGDVIRTSPQRTLTHC